MRSFYIYILANPSRRIYVGMTNDLLRRMWEHRFDPRPSFTHRYGITKLVHYEETSSARSAIAREKELKRWHRPRKLRLIERHNAGWYDLAVDWFF